MLLRLIGKDALLMVVEAHGGTRIPIPTHARPDTLLGQLIGMPALLPLVKELGGTHVKVPLAKRWRIMVYRGQALSLSEIARRVQATESCVSKVLQSVGCTDGARAAEPSKAAFS